MKVLYFGPVWPGSTTLQRFMAMSRLDNVDAIQVDSREGVSERRSLLQRVFWKLRFPLDSQAENSRLLQAVQEHHPDVVFVEASKVIKRRTLEAIKNACKPILAYYTPDDIMAKHNLSFTLKATFSLWDIFFTTKTFNLRELEMEGVRRPTLVGNAYDPMLHRPYGASEVGPEFEQYDCVFIGTYEPQRAQSILALARAGITILVLGSDWKTRVSHPNLRVAGPVYAEDYAKYMHFGKIALCFLRKMNRDRITTRSVEIPAMGRAMVAEKTEEHDSHFLDGTEYIGFSNDQELVQKVTLLLRSPERMKAIGESGRRRCLSSGYSTDHRALQIYSELESARRQLFVADP